MTVTTIALSSSERIEKLVRDFVVTYQRNNNRWPAVEDIRAALRVRASGTIMQALANLQKQGLLDSQYEFDLRDLTPAQTSIYRYVVNYKQTHDGTSPSLREIMTGTKQRSTSTVRRTLIQLTDMGLLDFDPNQARTIRVIGGSYQYNFSLRTA